MTNLISPDTIYKAVSDRYAKIARTQDTSLESCCAPGSDPYAADSYGCEGYYDAALLTDLPGEVTGLSLGCGDPITGAKLQPGETVLDLGSGGGIDCFLAARAVGPAGRVIGVDMTPDMLARARANAEKLNAANVEFREGQIEALPVDDASVDVVISNCVINLSPDKPQVFRETFRVLKPGGRLAVSDIVTSGRMPEALQRNLQAWSACVSGAIPADEYAAGLRAAGFTDVRVEPRRSSDTVFSHIPAGTPYSASIIARKPEGDG